MLRIICISFSCLVATSAYAQSPAPGGVPGAVVWRTSSAGENEGLYWIDRLSATKGAPLSGNELPLFNFHPVPWLRDTEVAPSLPLPTRSLEQVTVFAVHHPADTLTEKVVWSLGAGDGRPVVLTTHRLADLRDTSYLNFPGPEKALPGIKTYYQRRPAAEETTAPSSPALLPGAPPGRPQLPVSNYRGLLPELIVYDRVLSPQERLQVESYLALKYGLTLAGEADYLNSAGEVIWERRRQGAFVHRLAGIGRDDGARLLQKQSTSSYEPELLTIAAGRPAPDNAANRSELPDQSWLIWGDDGGAWRLQPPEFAQPRRLDRSWRMTAHGFPPATTLQVDLGRFAPERTTGQTYWLLLDRSGTGKFASGQVDFFPANEIDARGLASFFHIGWDTDASGSDAFTLALGPAFLGLAWQEAPGCDPATPGRLFIGALGGQAPYRFQLDGPNGTERWQRDSGDLRELSGLPPGPYWLTVRDAAGALFRDSLFFQATDAPLSPLADEYTLAAGQELSLDAAVAGDGPRQYEWLAPDGRTHQGPQLNIRQPGAYQLTIERASCIARHLITVRAAPASPFREVALYPNPARREWPFQLAVHLTEAAAVQVSILDVGGRSIRERQLPADEYHLIRETLAAAGAYLIRVRSGAATQTLPLIVE